MLSDISSETLRTIQSELGDNPSERVAVIMSVAAIDRRLESLLRNFFTVTSGASKKEIDFFLTQRPCPPLESAGLRVRLARCLNLIDKDTAKALQHVIQCRNDYAHEVKPSVPLTSVVRKIISCCPRQDRKQMENAVKRFPVAAWQFVIICSCLDGSLVAMELFACDGLVATLNEVAELFAKHGNDKEAQQTLKVLAQRASAWDHKKYQRAILDFSTD